MNGIGVLRFSLVGAAAIAAVLLTGVLVASTVYAQENGVDIHSGSAELGGEDSVTVGAHDVGAPGLGAWTIDISYDSSLISAVDCTPEQGGVCNPNFADGMVRLTGASASGLEGDSRLGVIDFECGDAGGTSDLTIEIFTFADATIGGPMDIDASVSNGTFTCVAGGPATGTGFASGGTSYGWLLAVLAYLGVAGLAVGALRLRTQQ